MSIRFSSLLQQACLCLTLTYAAAGATQELFPRPAELQPDIDFWVNVYTEIDTSSGFIHDADNVSIIYETVHLGEDYYAGKKVMKAALARHVATLKRLAIRASGKLSAEEQRVLSLWGEGVDRARLRRAARNVRFQRGQSERFRQGLARSGEWNSYIDSVLAERGLPRELGVLPHVESSFNPEAYSNAGAAGIWQFTRATGRRFMRVDYVVDERMDPFAATVAAAQLLEHNYQLTGTWPLALTAYNHGASSMRRASRQLGTTDIATIVRDYKGRAFGFASRNFYLSFLAALEVSSNPERYFAPYASARPVSYAEIELPDYLLVDSFARAFNTDFSALKQHNRALLDPVWRGKKRIPAGFKMRVPRHELERPPAQLLAAIPAQERFSEQTPDLFHTVVRGDTVSEIATRYGHKLRDIAAMNGLNRHYKIRIGQVLRLPIDGSVVVADAAPLAAAHPSTHAAVAPEPDSPELAAIDSTDPLTEELLPTMAATELLADPSDYTVADDHTIVVQASETLGHYAEWLDVRASHLRRLSGRRYGRPLVIGQRLQMDFSKVSPQEFERRRTAYQSELQQAFFMAWHIRTTRQHVVARGESLWELTHQHYKVPLWLLRQYNPDLDPDRLHPGMVIVVPELAKA